MIFLIDMPTSIFIYKRECSYSFRCTSFCFQKFSRGFSSLWYSSTSLSRKKKKTWKERKRRERDWDWRCSSSSVSRIFLEKVNEREREREMSSSCGAIPTTSMMPLPLGFRFQPTDYELLIYLQRKILRLILPSNFIKEVELYKYHPTELIGL